MEKIILKPLIHRQQECIGIYFNNIAKLNNIIRKKAGARWSQTNKLWYIPFDKENYEKLKQALKGVATIDQSALHNYLVNKKKKQPAVVQASKQIQKTITIQLPEKIEKKITYKTIYKIHPVNAHILPLMKEQLQLKSYSASTARTYLQEMAQLLMKLNTIPADELTPENLKRYLVYCLEELKLKENTLHSRINALKFYYEQVLNREKFFWKIPRPKKPLQLPKLLNETELSKLFNALSNKKHKAMLFTIYSAGLRVSELVNLKISDIDSKRMQIFIERAKGKKDRVVNLSPVLLDILRSYIKNYKPKPKTYLFESKQTLGPYPTRTVQQIFGTAKKSAGIRKEVGIHSLRHSFATHLLDKGTDIKYIKDLLGHFNIKTTERYLHVSKKQLVNIISPFDDLWKNNSIDW